jgi:hypothetical protein
MTLTPKVFIDGDDYKLSDREKRIIDSNVFNLGWLS